MTTYSKTEHVDLAHYSRALDEIYRLRAALAYEARIVEAHMSYATFPKGRRPAAIDQVERMRAAAAGHAEREYAELSSQVLKHCLREAGAAEILTRGTWEASR